MLSRRQLRQYNVQGDQINMAVLSWYLVNLTLVYATVTENPVRQYIVARGEGRRKIEQLEPIAIPGRGEGEPV